MATSAGAFEQRERAAEQVWIKQEERTLMIKRLEKLVEQVGGRSKALQSPSPLLLGPWDFGVAERDLHPA